MSLAENYKAGKLDKSVYILAADMFNAICDKLGVGIRTGKGVKPENDDDRNKIKVRLRANLRYLITIIAHSNLSDFKVNNRITLIPIADAPIVQMLLTASVSKTRKSEKEEDWIIRQWFLEKYEMPQVNDYGMIWALYSTLETRIQNLCIEEKIDANTVQRWLSFLRIRLNYDNIAACFLMQKSIQSFLDLSRPMVPFIDYSTIEEAKSTEACSKTITLESTTMMSTLAFRELIETQYAPKLKTQDELVYFITQMIYALEASACKHSEQVMEMAYQQSVSGESMPILQDYSPNPNVSILGTPFSWDYLLQYSLTQNATLRRELQDNPVLKERVSEITEKEYQEFDRLYKVGKHGALEKKSLPERKK